MGVRIAWTFAALRPGRTDKLVLISPDGFAGPDMEYGIAQRAAHDEGAALRASDLHASCVAGSRLRQRRYDHGRPVCALPGHDACPGRTARDSQQDGSATAGGPDPATAPDRRADLGDVERKDGIVPLSNAADYRSLLPHSNLAALPGIGHIPQEEAPATVRTVRAFLPR